MATAVSSSFRRSGVNCASRGFCSGTIRPSRPRCAGTWFRTPCEYARWDETKRAMLGHAP